MLQCPKCHSERLGRSRRRGLIERQLLTAIALRPFRCESCNHRFFRWPKPLNQEPTPPSTLAPVDSRER
jgi:DNA-directed RNA polymerase subunit RPC12/RpoP